MKKLFTLFLAIMASVSMMANGIQIGDLYYILNQNTRTAEVTYKSYNYDKMYNYQWDITTADIPSSVTYEGIEYVVNSIGYHAFDNCKKLQSVVIPNSVTSIQSYAFEYCRYLSSVTIPGSVTTIEGNAFDGCGSLTSLQIPNSVTRIGYRAFFAVPNVIYSGTATGYPWEAANINCYGEGWFVYKDSSKKQLLRGAYAAEGDIVIDENVISIGDNAFSGNSAIRSVTMTHVETIGEGAFEGCENLSTLQMPESLTTIGGYAFRYCYALSSVSVPNSVISVGYNAFDGVPNVIYSGTAKNAPWMARCLNGVVDGYFVFSDETKTDLRACFTSAPDTVFIPEGTLIINNNAFDHCSNVKSITIPNSLTTIKRYAISTGNSNIDLHISDLAHWCSIQFDYDWSYSGTLYLNGEKVTNLVIPNNVESISDYAFCSMDTIVSVLFPSSLKSIGAYAFYECNLTHVDIPDNVTTIGDGAFIWCYELTDVTIGGGITKFGSSVFYADKALTSVTLKEGITEIGIAAFRSTGIDTLIVPNSVKSIRTSAFSLCDSLAFVSLGTGLTSIGEKAFWACKKLTSIVIPDNVTYIDKAAFQSCHKLKEVTLSNNLKTIYENTFNYCDSLTYIRIPESVTRIREDAFSNCKNLKFIQVDNPMPPSINSSTFSNIHNEHIVFVPFGAKEAYLSAQYWQNMNIKEAYSFETKSASTSASLQFTHYFWEYDNNYIDSVGIEGGENFAGNVLEYIGLEPNSEYKDIPVVLTANTGEKEIMNISFKTEALTLTTKESKPVSETTALLFAETNMSDAETNCGFEWKRENAPEGMAGTKVFCPVASGMMAGRLKNLKDDVYYKYRAFYQSAAGQMYYGEWQYIFTGDVTVEFDPVLYTYSATVVKETEATISGYALAGAADFTEQGFEYWAESRATEPTTMSLRKMKNALGEHFFVQASGITMRVTLTNLDAGTVYKYRAYGKVGEQVYYGAEQSFTTRGTYVAPSYLITFLNWDGTELQKSQVATGTLPEYTGVTPVRPDDEQYTYIFKGWTPELVAVTADAVYTAEFYAEEATAIDNVQTPKVQCTKLIENGVLYLIFNGTKYNIQGQVVK